MFLSPKDNKYPMERSLLERRKYHLYQFHDEYGSNLNYKLRLKEWGSGNGNEVLTENQKIWLKQHPHTSQPKDNFFFPTP